MYTTNAVLHNWPLIGITKIFLDPFLCNFMWPKTSDNDFWKKDINQSSLVYSVPKKNF